MGIRFGGLGSITNKLLSFRQKNPISRQNNINLSAKNWHPLKNDLINKNLKEQSNCRRCRLKKCLFMGMDPRKVISMEGTDKGEHKKFIEKMKEWQNRLWQGENVQIEVWPIFWF
jgi:hypothetical protein